jgi:predicted Zn-dependent protease
MINASTIKKYWASTHIMLLLALIATDSLAVSGSEIYREITATTGIYKDEKLQNYITSLGNQIVEQSEKAGEKFTFTLLDSPTLNAFATKGNYVYINRGLLTYVSNEAQLVSVLAHEVAHITKDHINSQEGITSGAQVLATVAAVLSGSNEVYEAGMAYANSLIKGHGRRNELEADEAGAEYMAKLGYDPQQMIDMLSLMKDYESLLKKRAKSRGVSQQTYHGIFSTHPRNDSRLRTVVSKAQKLKAEISKGNGATNYRMLTEGLVWGENFVAKQQQPQRYSNMPLRIRMDFPEQWQQTTNIDNFLVVGESQDKMASLSLQSMPRTLQTPEEYIFNQLKISGLSQGQTINPAKLKGFTGIVPSHNGTSATRIALIYYKMNAYLITGKVTDKAQLNTVDPLFMASINTFRPISNREIAGQRPQTIHYLQADSSTSFASLAKQFKLNAEDIENLRLINGLYPAGEPKSGQWIKVFKR